jgi:hypothetical protein
VTHSADEATAALDAIELRDERARELGFDRDPQDIPCLIETGRAAVQLAVTWTGDAGRLDAKADASGGISSAILNARAQAREDCARELLDAIGGVLAGKESTDG